MMSVIISRSVTRRSSVGFTLIELLVVMAITSLTIALLLPALKKARESAQRIVCLSNLTQMHLGASLYYHDYDGELPWSWDPTPATPWINGGNLGMNTARIESGGPIGYDSGMVVFCVNYFET